MMASEMFSGVNTTLSSGEILRLRICLWKTLRFPLGLSGCSTNCLFKAAQHLIESSGVYPFSKVRVGCSLIRGFIRFWNLYPTLLNVDTISLCNGQLLGCQSPFPLPLNGWQLDYVFSERLFVLLFWTLHEGSWDVSWQYARRYAAFRSLQKYITKSFFARISVLGCGQLTKLSFTHIPEHVPLCLLKVDKSSFFGSNEVRTFINFND